MKILFLGDVMGRAGRRAITERLATLRARLKADLVIVNAENASGGRGATLLTLARPRPRKIVMYTHPMSNSQRQTENFADVGNYS